MVRIGPFSASGGTITFTREPSGRRASTIGEASSTRRPTAATMRSITRIRWLSSANRASVSYSTPARSMNTWSWPLTMISVIVSSRRNGSIGP